jgi:RHS repeat-associated protein
MQDKLGYGAVRSSTGTSTSKHKFVGSLGHPSEDETGLTYMQARYYDPQTGRFSSEDSALHGTNWYVYCSNNPTNFSDADGKINEASWLIIRLFLQTYLGNYTLSRVVPPGLEHLFFIMSLVEQYYDLSRQIFQLQITVVEAGIFEPNMVGYVNSTILVCSALQCLLVLIIGYQIYVEIQFMMNESDDTPPLGDV